MSASWIEAVCARLSANRRVRRSLPVWGRVHVDRQLPFLCVYRRPVGRQDGGTERLLVGEASYVIAPGSRSMHAPLSRLVGEIAAVQSGVFGGMLLLELWSAPDKSPPAENENAPPAPSFRVFASDAALSSTLERLSRSLKTIRILRQPARVEVTRGAPTPPGLGRLLPAGRLQSLGAHVLGLEIDPIYRNPRNGEVYPLLLRSLHRSISRALKQAFFEFSRSRTTHAPPHYLALGRRAMVKAVWEADRRLAEVSNAFDLLLAVTPINVEAAYAAFRRSGFTKIPPFQYRPRPVDPSLLKRELFDIVVERIEDPVVERIFREKQEELGGRLDMLGDRGTGRFLYSSLKVFGGVDDELLDGALEILRRISPRARDSASGRPLSAGEFAAAASAEFAFYHQQSPSFTATAEVRDDLASMLVSHGRLLVGQHIRVPRGRETALIQHEVGTHLVTYYNGRAQKFKQLYTGLAGYDKLQEGLAVLAEHLVGGLSPSRLRTVAARVVAVRRLIDGASFVDTFRELCETHALDRKGAFHIVMRVFRGGGLTKDAIYLKGLVELLQYIAKGGDVEILFVGKIAAHHVPIVKELLWRGVLVTPPLRPRYMNDPEAIARLDRLRAGAAPLDLVKRKRRT